MSADTNIRAVVCIPTFRRPEWLARTLTSVLSQKTDFAFAIVVVDNDGAGQAGAAVARTLLADIEAGLVLVEHKQGNCHAINTAFGAARKHFSTADYLLMIDDDEEAMPGWLQAMVDAADGSGADIVGGPVNREMVTPPGPGIAEHPLFFSIAQPTGAIDMIHGSGNCLISRRVFETLPSPELDLRFNFLGGGDMDFFTRCRKAGKRFFWSSEAVVLEYVPAERLTAKFLMRRSLRTGMINYAIDRKYRPGAAGLATLALKNLVSLGLSLPRAIGLLVQRRHWLPASHPPLMSIGRMAAMFGGTAEPYKVSNTPLAAAPDTKP